MRMSFTEAEIDYIEKNIGKRNLYADTRNRIVASLYAKGAILFYDPETLEPVPKDDQSRDVVGGIIRFVPELAAEMRRRGGLR